MNFHILVTVNSLVIFETRPEARRVCNGGIETGEVDHGVGHQEKVGDDRSNEVQRT